MMQPFPPTVILRHRRENLKKCSLRGLEIRSDLHFLTYPKDSLPSLDHYIILSIDGPPLSKKDSQRGLLILDGTWRYAEKMMKFVESQVTLEKRSIPKEYQTAYPRRQEDCPDPTVGLASVEALYIAYHLLGHDTSGLLDNYHWKDEFLKKNFG